MRFFDNVIRDMVKVVYDAWENVTLKQQHQLEQEVVNDRKKRIGELDDTTQKSAECNEGAQQTQYEQYPK